MIKLENFKVAIAQKMLLHSRKNRAFNLIEAEKIQSVDYSISNFNDSFYFFATADDGSYLIIRQAFRSDDKNELWIVLQLKDGSLYEFSQKSDISISHANAPVKMSCIESGKKWQISFDLSLDSENGSKNVSAELNFSSDQEIFHFSYDLAPSFMSQAMAKEKWSRTWFKKLQSMDQDHYEQGGKLSGIVEIDNKKINLNMKCMRDHSFGPRSWSDMQRHIWVSILFEDGTDFNINLVDYPQLKLTTGYLTNNDGSHISIGSHTTFDNIISDNFPRKEINFEFKTQSGELFSLTAYPMVSHSWLMGSDYQLTEWVTDFVLNGKKGRGIYEYGIQTKKI